MKKAIFLLLDEYAEWEGAYLSSTLNQDKEWEVKTASVQNKVTSIGGFTTLVEYSIESIPKNIDLLILVGGNSWNIEHSELKELITKVLDENIVVGAICGAVDYLARNSMLNDYTHTGNSLDLWKDYSDYTNEDNFIEKQAIQDKNLITANGTASIEFTELVLRTVNFSTDQEIGKLIALYKFGFYDFCKKYGNPYR